MRANPRRAFLLGVSEAILEPMTSRLLNQSLFNHRTLLSGVLLSTFGFSACGGEEGLPGESGGAAAVDAAGGSENNVSGGAPGSGGASPSGGSLATGGEGPVSSGGASSSGGMSAAGGESTSGSGGNDVGSGGDDSGSGGASGNVGPFTCNQWTGGALMDELFAAGFENTFEASRWQLKWLNTAEVQNWENPNSSWWKAPIESACASGSTSPDHVVFMVFSWGLSNDADQAKWYASIKKTTETFFSQYTDLKRLDLMYQVTGPDNMLCPGQIAPETIVASPELVSAMEDVAADFPGKVFVAPRWEARSCADFMNAGPHLNNAANTAALTEMVKYFLPDLQ